MSLISVFEAVRIASRKLLLLSDTTINKILLAVADEAVASTSEILSANAQDLAAMDILNPKYDRLLLSPERIETIANDMRAVALLDSPLDNVLSRVERPNGLIIEKTSVPFGVIGIIYEARPNVSFDVFSLCLKSGNACVLKGGSDANNSNVAIIEVIHRVLDRFGIDRNSVVLLENNREATTELLHAVGKVDLIIPRGSKSLIDFVRNNARVPVIETGAGICHTYVDATADTEMAKAIIMNAKTRRVSVCNSLDCIVLHAQQLSHIAEICAPLVTKNVVIYADTPAYAALQGVYPTALLFEATEESFGTEFLDYKLSIKTVETLDEAIDHITCYSSKHSETIVSGDAASIARFTKEIDAACVYANVSTAFTDGSQFGFGAEIGISTQKLHARGPMALPELTTYKYIIKGNGQIRE